MFALGLAAFDQNSPCNFDEKTFLLQTLAEWGITSAMVAFAKNDSKNIQELIARVLNAVCKFGELRGFVVQQGGSKALVGLALEGTDKGKRHAAQALARIGITQDPSIAFPGQRVSDFAFSKARNIVFSV